VNRFMMDRHRYLKIIFYQPLLFCMYIHTYIFSFGENPYPDVTRLSLYVHGWVLSALHEPVAQRQ
jgi:hypothetical protein